MKQVILISGATRGMGFVTAARLHRRGTASSAPVATQARQMHLFGCCHWTWVTRRRCRRALPR